MAGPCPTSRSRPRCLPIRSKRSVSSMTRRGSVSTRGRRARAGWGSAWMWAGRSGSCIPWPREEWDPQGEDRPRRNDCLCRCVRDRDHHLTHGWQSQRASPAFGARATSRGARRRAPMVSIARVMRPVVAGFYSRYAGPSSPSTLSSACPQTETLPSSRAPSASP
jgi:hypothetical protein